MCSFKLPQILAKLLRDPDEKTESFVLYYWPLKHSSNLYGYKPCTLLWLPLFFQKLPFILLWQDIACLCSKLAQLPLASLEHFLRLWKDPLDKLAYHQKAFEQYFSDLKRFDSPYIQ